MADRWVDTVGTWDVAGGAHQNGAESRGIDRPFLGTLMLHCNIRVSFDVARQGRDRRR
jgi:hypothetical protein